MIALLHDFGVLSEERIELLLSWRNSGFSVHNAVRVAAGDTAGIERLGRFIDDPSARRTTNHVLLARSSSSCRPAPTPPRSMTRGSVNGRWNRCSIATGWKATTRRVPVACRQHSPLVPDGPPRHRHRPHTGLLCVCYGADREGDPPSFHRILCLYDLHDLVGGAAPFHGMVGDTAAARLFGISRRTLYRRLQQLGLDR